MSEGLPDDERAVAREALSVASSHGEPDVERLVQGLPAAFEAAERRRRAPERIASAAAFWIPRLGLATALLAAAAWLWPARSGGAPAATARDDDSSLDTWIVTGRADRLSDPLLDALVRPEGERER